MQKTLGLVALVVALACAAAVASASLVHNAEMSVGAIYVPADSQRAALYSASAYCDMSQVRDFACLPCQRIGGAKSAIVVQHISTKDSTHVFIAYNPMYHEIAVSFRGTEGAPSDWSPRSVRALMNWITNLDATSTPWYNNTRVHAGFRRAYLNVADGVRAAVRSLFFKATDLWNEYAAEAHPDLLAAAAAGRATLPTATPPRIIITGHSLGGALATACAADLYATLPELEATRNVWLYTFGAPRFGDTAFYQLMKTAIPNSFRIVHSNDIVPHVPPMSSPVGDYWHVAREIWYKKDSAGAYTVCPDTGDDAECSNSLGVLYWATPHYSYMGLDISGMCRDCKASGLQACKTGYWGDCCDSACPPNCAGNVCERQTGNCSACKPGFCGPDCTQKCAQWNAAVDE